jgi:hypothetical protein
MKRSIVTYFLVAILAMYIMTSCSKDNSDPGISYNLSYGDSIIYLRPSSGDYTIRPLTHRQGAYSGFPDGIEIDEETGEINVSKSETGLRYRITHTAPDGTTTSIKIVLSGITFFDQYYRLSQNDTIAFPIYNANPSSALPVTGSVFDDGGGASASGCDVRTVNGQINLAQSIRNGLFGPSPSNDDRKDIDIVYRLNDGSGKSVNKLRVRLYYYTSMATVAPDLLETLNERRDEGVFLKGNQTARTAREARPRPPCVIILAN